MCMCTIRRWVRTFCAASSHMSVWLGGAPLWSWSSPSLWWSLLHPIRCVTHLWWHTGWRGTGLYKGGDNCEREDGQLSWYRHTMTTRSNYVAFTSVCRTKDSKSLEQWRKLGFLYPSKNRERSQFRRSMAFLRELIHSCRIGCLRKGVAKCRIE